MAERECGLGWYHCNGCEHNGRHEERRGACDYMCGYYPVKKKCGVIEEGKKEEEVSVREQYHPTRWGWA